MKREANFQVRFNHWVREVYKDTAAFELKQTTGNSIPFSDVVEHQVNALMQAKHGTLVYKIPDSGFQNPFDSFCMSGVNAYVVFKYPEFFCLIDIDDFIEEEMRAERKSLTADRAKEIATTVVSL